MAGIETQYGHIEFDSNYDFGFEAVDETEYESHQQETSEIVRTVSEGMDREFSDELEKLTEKINAMIQSQQSDRDEIENRKIEVEAKVKSKLDEIEKMILPLLYNLLKNKDKEYIYWPNRESIVKGQIDKILAITRSE